MDQHSTWTIGGSSVPNLPNVTKKVAYFEPFIVTEKTTKEMKVTIERWNLMQKCLIDNGLMESK